MATMYTPSQFDKYKVKFIQAAKEQVSLEKPYDKAVRAVAKFYMGTKRRKDLPNAGKLEFDALNDIVYEDDSQICKLDSEKIYSKGAPRIELEIYKYPEAQWT